MSIFIQLSVSIYLSMYYSIPFDICVSLSVSISIYLYLCIYLPFDRSNFIYLILSIYLFISIYLSMYQYILISIIVKPYLSVNLHQYLFIYLCIYTFLYLPILLYTICNYLFLSISVRHDSLAVNFAQLVHNSSILTLILKIKESIRIYIISFPFYNLYHIIYILEFISQYLYG